MSSFRVTAREQFTSDLSIFQFAVACPPQLSKLKLMNAPFETAKFIRRNANRIRGGKYFFIHEKHLQPINQANPLLHDWKKRKLQPVRSVEV
jgi:hypothetical protein